MPIVDIEFDKNKLTKKEVFDISNAMQKIVSEATKIDDVFVYANSAQVMVKAAPIEIFVRMSDHKIKDADQLMAELKKQVIAWKKKSKFKHLINLSLIPMHWKIEIGI